MGSVGVQTAVSNVRKARLDRRITARYTLAEPIRLEHGKHISRYGSAGYWLPMLATEVELITNLYDDGDDTMTVTWNVRLLGKTITKNGRLGQDCARYANRGATLTLDADVPEVVAAILAEFAAIARTEHAWPA